MLYNLHKQELGSLQPIYKERKGKNIELILNRLGFYKLWKPNLAIDEEQF